MNVSAWRKSSRSGGSGAGGSCVEVGAWRKSSRSGSSDGGNCVEVGATAAVTTSTAAIAIRDTKHVTGPVLTTGRRDWTSFLAALKTGGFDA